MKVTKRHVLKLANPKQMRAGCSNAKSYFFPLHFWTTKHPPEFSRFTRRINRTPQNNTLRETWLFAYSIYCGFVMHTSEC